MALRKISARQALKDIESGMDDSALIRKYRLKPEALHRVFRELIDMGLVTQAEVENRGSGVPITTGVDWDHDTPQLGSYDEDTAANYVAILEATATPELQTDTEYAEAKRLTPIGPVVDWAKCECPKKAYAEKGEPKTASGLAEPAALLFAACMVGWLAAGLLATDQLWFMRYFLAAGGASFAVFTVAANKVGFGTKRLVTAGIALLLVNVALMFTLA